MLERRTAEIARSFQLALLAASAASGAAVWAACTSNDGASGVDAGTDATTPADVAVAGDATTDADASSGPDAASISCYGTVSSSDAAPDTEEICSYFLPCGLRSDNLTALGCTVLPEDLDGAPYLDASGIGFPVCTLVEGQGCVDGSYVLTATGAAFTCVGCPGGGGRRPAGMGVERGRGRTAAGACFAAIAELEAASVRAFEDLAKDLMMHGAPDALVRAAKSSARDELRHARLVSRLARRHGGEPRAGWRGRPAAERSCVSLVSLARANAVEGCVRETFGALLNAWQASHARDPSVRAAMAAIAPDELRHAALAWEIAEWVLPLLSAAERRSVTRAQRRAVTRLVARAERDADPALRRIAGLPDACAAGAMARGLARELFAA